VRRVDLDRLRARALSHVSLRIRCDSDVLDPDVIALTAKGPSLLLCWIRTVIVGSDGNCCFLLEEPEDLGVDWGGPWLLLPMGLVALRLVRVARL
jgi:hypothetical protein